MKVYFDSSPLISYLYGELDEPDRFIRTARVLEAIRSGGVEGGVSFYVLPELFAYVDAHYPADIANTVFRLSLVELFSFPLFVLPHIDRTELNLWRRRFHLADSYDELHVACALANGFNAIVTYDHHFQDVADLIPCYTPEELLNTLEERTEQ